MTPNGKTFPALDETAGPDRSVIQINLSVVIRRDLCVEAFAWSGPAGALVSCGERAEQKCQQGQLAGTMSMFGFGKKKDIKETVCVSSLCQIGRAASRWAGLTCRTVAIQVREQTRELKKDERGIEREYVALERVVSPCQDLHLLRYAPPSRAAVLRRVRFRRRKRSSSLRSRRLQKRDRSRMRASSRSSW